jgi:hypothetical protein
MKYPLLILLLICTLSVNAQLIQKKDFRFKSSDKPFLLNTESKNQSNVSAVKSGKKNLFLAGVLSFIVPGLALGQFYKEEYINGAVRVGISLLCVAWMGFSPSVDFGGGGNGDQMIMAGILFAANWVFSIIDASLPDKEKAPQKSGRQFRKYFFRFLSGAWQAYLRPQQDNRNQICIRSI